MPRRQDNRNQLFQQLILLVCLLVGTVGILEYKGVGVFETVENSWHYYFPEESIAEVSKQGATVAKLDNNTEQQSNTAKQLDAAAEQQSNDKRQPSALLDAIPSIPRVALHSLDFQSNAAGTHAAATAELISSLLLIKMGESKVFELLDRSLVPQLMRERTHLGGSDSQSDLSGIRKLPLANYVLLGSLFDNDNNKSFSLKLIDSRTARVLAAKQFEFDAERSGVSMQQALAFVEKTLHEQQHSERGAESTTKRIAFSHFLNLNEAEGEANKGQLLVDQLIEAYSNNDKLSVLSRTHMTPLLFEELLRQIQYVEDRQESIKIDADYLVYGRYREHQSATSSDITVYLYIDMMKFDRDAIVLKVDSWQSAYQEIKRVLDDYVVDTTVDNERQSRSQQLLIDAAQLIEPHLWSAIVKGNKPVMPGNFSRLDSVSAETYTQAKSLVQQALQANPGNSYAELAKATFLQHEGEKDAYVALLRKIIRSGDTEARKKAHWMLSSYYRNIKINGNMFEDLLGARLSQQVFDELLRDNYFTQHGNYFSFNSGRSDYILNRSAELHFAALSDEQSLQVVEQLRSRFFNPGDKVQFKANKSNQSRYSDGKNLEAEIHFGIGQTLSRLYIENINDNVKLPSIEKFYQGGSNNNKVITRDLVYASDSFANAAYLDREYLKAFILLGYSLCLEQMQQCSLGETVLNWVVENVVAANIPGRYGLYFTVDKQSIKRNKLIFLAADLVDRVSDTPVTEYMRDMLSVNRYFTNKARQRVDAIKAELPKEKVLSFGEDNLPTYEQKRSLLLAYSELIRSYCENFPQEHLHHRFSEHGNAMEAMAKLVGSDKKLATYRSSLLTTVKQEFPIYYPYMLASAQGVTPALKSEQLEMLSAISKGGLIPYKVSDYMELELKRYKAIVGRKNDNLAKRYIDNFAGYFRITEKTVLDFAYMYASVGDTFKAKSLLERYAKNSFEVEDNSSSATLTDAYVFSGVDDRGRLMFSRTSRNGDYFLYTGISPFNIVTDHPIKWSFHRASNGAFYSGERDNAKPGTIAFRYRKTYLRGIQFVWGNASDPLDSDVGNTALTNSGYKPITALPVSVVKSQDSRASIEQLFLQGYTIGASHNAAVKGFINKRTKGPLRDEYFSPGFAKTRDIKVIKELLFNKGYLSVSGIPLLAGEDVFQGKTTFVDRQAVTKRIAADFPDYQSWEQGKIRDALQLALGVKGAGSVDVYERRGETWQINEQLTAEDALPDRHFGLAVAVHDDKLLVCDYIDGLYSFRKIEGKWQQQQRLTTQCNHLAMNNDYTVATTREKLIVYKLEGDVWNKAQTLTARNYLTNKDKRWNFENFGRAMSMTKNTLAVGNRFGGPERRGEVYIFELQNGQWQQTDKLQPTAEDSGSFGASVALSDKVLLIGEPSSGPVGSPNLQTGAVSVFEKADNSWHMKKRIHPQLSDQQVRSFGSRLYIENSTTLIAAKQQIYRVDLAAEN